MYKVGIKNSFTAKHFLRGDFDEESLPHSHPYEVEWRCSTKELDENGFSIDIALMKTVLEDVLARIDGRLLNDLPFFEQRQPSVENCAQYISSSILSAPEMKHLITPALSEMEIRIWEAPDAWASYVHSLSV